MKIGTLSFAKKGDQFELSAVERNCRIAELALTRSPDLLLCAGWSVMTFEDVKAVAAKIGKDSATHVVIESQFDNLPGDKVGDRYHIVYLISPGKEITCLGRQIFAQAKEIQGEGGQERLDAFNRTISRRQGAVGNLRLMSLCCGEINIVQGRNNVRVMSECAEFALDAADIIVNPTHDLMGNHGTLIAKRKWLSRSIDGRDRFYISASNWDNAGYSIDKDGCRRPRRKQRPESDMLHSVFCNGERQKMTFLSDGKNGYMYREWDKANVD